MLEKLFRSTAEVKTLGVVLNSEDLHLREIARRAGVSPYEAKKELGNLTELGLLISERKGNQVFFRTNPSCPFFPEVKGLYLKTEGFIPAIRSALLDEGGVKYGFVFGSVASGSEKKGSDIDLMVIGSFDQSKLSSRIFSLQKGFSREINPIFWTEADLGEKASGNSAFLKSLIKGKRIWLCGEEREFVRAAEKGLGKKGRF